jgi:hypothetical protein
MIELDRREIGRFRAAVRRCVAGRPRGLAPPILMQQDAEGLTLSAVLHEVTVAWRLPRVGAQAARLIAPFSVFTNAEERDSDKITLDEDAPGCVRCRWLEQGEARELEHEAVPADAQPDGPPPVGKLHPMDASLLAALHACGQTASREATGPFAITRLQVRGEAGQIVGTDGKQLLIWGSFSFPFAESMLIPAIPFFGARELGAEQPVRLGRTAKHLVIAAGSWTIWLTIDSASRFPDVTSVIPKSTRASKLVLDDTEAVAMLEHLQRAPEADDEITQAVVDLGVRPELRWLEDPAGKHGRVILMRSVRSGPGTTVVLNPKALARALSLGFREIRATSAEAPVLFQDPFRLLLLITLGTAPAAGTPARDRQPSPASQPACPALQEGDNPMSAERNGRPPADPPGSDDILDPLTEAEALRTAMIDVGRRVGRVIASLRQFQKQRRALHAAWTSLQHLRLGPQEAR